MWKWGLTSKTSLCIVFLLYSGIFCQNQTLVHFLRDNDPFYQSKSVWTHCASSSYPKQRHLWYFSERRSHICKHTVTMKNRRIMSKHKGRVLHKGNIVEIQTLQQPCALEITPTAWCMYTSMWTHRALGRWRIKQKINTAAKLGDNGRLVQEEQTVNSCIHTPTVCLGLFVGTSRWA